MKNFFIVKAGQTFANTARQFGDFEDWTLAGLGLPTEVVSVINAQMEEPLPPAEECGGVVVTGSHSMVTDQEDWSERLSDWIGGLIEASVPFLGICYGHQLLAKSAGGVVGYHPSGKEIGTVEIDLLPACANDPLFCDLPAQFGAHATHSQSILTPPENATRLAANAFEQHHAIRVGDFAWGIQFHPEYDTRIMHSYIAEQEPDLAAAGLYPADLYATVTHTPEAASILTRFARITSERQ